MNQKSIKAVVMNKNKKKILDSFMKEKILNAAITVLQNEGAKFLTMSKVANTAEIAKGTVYLYFKNKEELVKELVMKIKIPIQNELVKIQKSDLSVFEKIEKIFLFILKDIEKNLAFIRTIIPAVKGCEGLKNFFYQDDQNYINLFADILRQGIKNNEIEIDNPNYVAKIIFATLFYLIKERKDGFVKFMTIKKEVKSFMSVFNNGVKKKKC
jgi:AcrR family transcriptional regulator